MRARWLRTGDASRWPGVVALGLLCALSALPALIQDAGRQEAPPAELPSALAEALAAVIAARDAGEVAGAREGLTALLESAAYTQLLASDHEVAVAGLAELDAAAKSLDLPLQQLELRTQRLARLAERLPPDHADVLKAEQLLGATRYKLGDTEGAHALFEKVYEAQIRLLPEDHPERLKAVKNLALTRRRKGDLDGAYELLLQVLEVRERTLPPDDPGVLGARTDVAMVLADRGDLAQALELQESVHAERERVLDPEDPVLLQTKDNLGVYRLEVGDVAGARELAEHVHAVRVRTLPADHPALLRAQHNLATLRNALGDLDGARELLEAVHGVLAATREPDDTFLLTVQEALGGIRLKLGDVAGARELYEPILAARTRVLPPGHPDILDAKENLAIALDALGEHDRARDLMHEVLTVLRNELPLDHPEVLHAQITRANQLRRLGDEQAALELYERVLEARERQLPEDHPELLRARLLVACGRHAVGDPEEATAMARSLLNGVRAHVRSLQSEPPRIARAGAVQDLDFLGAPLSWIGGPAPGDEALTAALFETIESLRQTATWSGQAAAATARDPALVRARDRIARVRARLGDLVVAPPGTPEALEAWRGDVVELAEERDRLERALLSQLQERGVFLELPELGRVARGLAPEAALVSFLRYVGETSDTAPPVDSLLAFVVTPDARVRCVQLGPCAPIEDAAGRWRAALGEPVARGLAVPSDQELETGRRLRELILDPCLAALDTEHPPGTLHVVLDDFLHLVPIEALPAASEGRVGETVRIQLEVSTRRLFERLPPTDEAGILLAIGDVDFDAGATDTAGALGAVAYRSVDTRAGPRHGWGRLLQTRFEIEALALLYEEAFGSEPVLLQRERASKAALRDLAPGCRFLHVATHGWFAPESVPSWTDEREQDPELVTSARANRAVRGFAPEALCGLALAGANNEPDDRGGSPGVLTAEELAGLDLSSCELAVLSACETNVGLRRAGQGIRSLQSALHAAGARTAVTSLWKVDDAVTRRLMELFYTALWSEGLGKADALWKAKKALMDEGHPVRDWAAWVFTGDPD